MKARVKMLKDYYYPHGKHEVWWSGNERVIDEIKDQVCIDYLEIDEYIEVIEYL
ncbi:hypothetical protein SAMN04487895_101543 [Paenibacillus sophorae]|uniref:Uncharacterized protein n=1 Tax=Paenibacillus sophorae TaxID=1333845 RepID=A0A1H8GK84_9BACL|nr:hypothetical protein [Paenibacillus sophorae]QWU14251.1 hypothetical protein KP014_20285 [Paenibacillus sophorae]SEN44220.1 hypothetical protein SAMN04487895_101543 [Paenibacillus sophorae]